MSEAPRGSRLPWRVAGRSWVSGIGLGVRLVPIAPVLALKRLVLPVSYWRAAEFGYAFAKLASLSPGSRVLDVGSPKELAYMLAASLRHDVWATDILPSAVAQAELYGRALRGQRIHAERQDGRQLSYESASFDGAVSVSVLEHVPENGDTAALSELVRAVKPGGIIVITTPFAPTYRETHVPRSVYDRERLRDELVFYQRHYDWAALETRLLRLANVDLIDIELWGEPGVRIERAMNSLGRFRALVSPFEAWLACLGLSCVSLDAASCAMAAFFTLRKRGQSHLA